MALIHWWPLTGDCKDYGTNCTGGSIVGNASFNSTGKIGKSLKAGNGSAVSNGVSVPTNLVNELDGTQYSISVWVCPDGTHPNYEGAILSSGNWNQECWAFGVSQDNSQVDVFSNGYVDYITCSVPVGSWTHLVCTKKSGSIKLYKNGSYVGSYADSSTAFTSDASNLMIGRETYASGYFSFNGKINDVRIYDTCISDQEIEELYKCCVLDWRFSEAGFSSSSIADSSGYRNNGTMTSMGLSTDSNIGSNSGHITSSSSKVNCSNSNAFLASLSNATVAMWMKPITFGSSGFVAVMSNTSSNYTLCSDNGTSALRGNSASYYFDGVKSASCKNDGKWHYYVAAGINLSAWTSFGINTYGGGWALTDAYISDFKIYATALTEEQIKEEYRSHTQFANDNSIFTSEFVELESTETLNVKDIINSNGVVKAYSFTEGTDGKIVLSDNKAITANGFNEK